MKKLFLTSILLVSVLAALAGCGGGNSGRDPARVIYVAGGYGNFGSFNEEQACYWTGQTRIMLGDEGRHSEAKALFVSGGNVYIAGDCYNSASTAYTACYWLNSKENRVVLDSDEASKLSYAYSIYVSGGGIHVAGQDSDGHACFWLNDRDQKTVLDSTSSSEATAIFVVGSNVYVAGNAGSPKTPYYWQNNKDNKTPLTDGSYVRSIFVAGDGTVYAAGRYEQNSHSYACYWINGVRHILEDTEFSEAYSIRVHGGTIYVAGYHSPSGYSFGQACYWTVGTASPDEATMVPLDRGSSSSCSANAIFVCDNGDIYTAGHYRDSDEPKHACYWKNQNTTPVPLDTSAQSSWATSIYVQPE